MHKLLCSESRHGKANSDYALGRYHKTSCARTLVFMFGVKYKCFPDTRVVLCYSIFQVGNQLLSCSILLAMLVTALGGCYMIEQPGSSRLPLYPRWEQWVFTKDIVIWTAAWWARLYGALTPKKKKKGNKTVYSGNCHLKQTQLLDTLPFFLHYFVKHFWNLLPCVLEAPSA